MPEIGERVEVKTKLPAAEPLDPKKPARPRPRPKTQAVLFVREFRAPGVWQFEGVRVPSGERCVYQLQDGGEPDKATHYTLAEGVEPWTGA